MAKVLYVGDPHAKPDCLDEMAKLVEFIWTVAEANVVDYIVFLGDQFHTHSIIHLSVLNFWRHAFERLSKGPKVLALVGNHDISGKIGDYANAMMLYNPNHVKVINLPIKIQGILFVPYQHSRDDFVEICRSGETDTVVCHQTFDGSKYENGFPAKDGVDPNLIPQKWVISGHIHTPQTIGKIWYPGAPRWQTISDANVQRAIWVVDHDTGDMKPFGTEKACRPIYALVDRPEEPVVLPDVEASIVVDVYGSSEHVKTRSAELEKLGVRVRPFPTLLKAPKVKESDGLPLSFTKFIFDYVPKHGTDKNKILELARKRISWMRNE